MARQKIKSCILDGAVLADAAAVYRALGDALGAPAYFGHNPDALWDAIGDYHGEPVEIVWRAASRTGRRGREGPRRESDGRRAGSRAAIPLGRCPPAG